MIDIAAIAKKHLGITTLETRNSDRLDFYEVNASNIKAALEAAYRAGQQEPIETQACDDSKSMYLISAGNLGEVIEMIVVTAEEEIPAAISSFVEMTECDPEQICINRVGEIVPTSKYTK